MTSTSRTGARDLPPEVWSFLKSRGFFAMIIGKSYGGLGFSAYAHSCVLVKLASRSVVCASTVAVPNSLGPAELLNHYGTEEQKAHYLPRLARGEDIPCFALTGPRVGSDAAAIPDTGIVCRGQWQGQEVLGLRLNFSKRYITLAPVATIIGLAFRMYDPERLLGGGRDLGITCALIASRHAGQWRSARGTCRSTSRSRTGRFAATTCSCRSTASSAASRWRARAGACWSSSFPSGAASRCLRIPPAARRRRPSPPAPMPASVASSTLPVGKFEGVEQAIARMVGLTYIMDAARSVTTAAIDAGARPAVPAAILKYHVTEMGRRVANDAMDVQGGKGIMLGPRNYLGRGYQSVPIAITVEGANILTRNLIIFGQGAIRCHPYVLREMSAARNPDRERGVDEFDRALFGHVGFHDLQRGAFAGHGAHLRAFRDACPTPGPTRRYYQHIERFSASFAFATDVAMLTLGGYLKKKESISARLGDVLSSMYLASMVLKHHEDQGSPAADLPIVEWSCRELLYQAQEQLHGVLRNFPVRPMAWLMRRFIFPRGLTYFAPADRLGSEVAGLAQTAGESRDAAGRRHLPRSRTSGNPLGQLQQALELSPNAELIEKKLRISGVKMKLITRPRPAGAD